VSDPAHSPEVARETMAERHARMLADAAAYAHRIVCAVKSAAPRLPPAGAIRPGSTTSTSVSTPA
jgi:hypothetical protein